MPYNKEIRLNLASSYSDLKEYKTAIEQYALITRLWPGDPKAFFFLARTYILDKQYDQALTTVKEAHAKAPADVKDLLLIGDLLFDRKEYKNAREVYLLALETKKDLAAVHQKLEQAKEAQKQQFNGLELQ